MSRGISCLLRYSSLEGSEADEHVAFCWPQWDGLREGFPGLRLSLGLPAKYCLVNASCFDVTQTSVSATPLTLNVVTSRRDPNPGCSSGFNSSHAVRNTGKAEN